MTENTIYGPEWAVICPLCGDTTEGYEVDEDNTVECGDDWRPQWVWGDTESLCRSDRRTMNCSSIRTEEVPTEHGETVEVEVVDCCSCRENCIGSRDGRRRIYT